MMVAYRGVMVDAERQKKGAASKGALWQLLVAPT
jgi:hypothetical protein